MRKSIVIAMSLIISAGTLTFADEPRENTDKNTPRQGRFLQDARTEDGKIDLAKALASDKAPEQMKEALKNADKDGDGFLTTDELKAMRHERFGDVKRKGGRRAPQRGSQFGWGAPMGAPQFGQPQPQFPFFGSHEGGKNAPKFEMPKFDFVNEDGAIDVAKLTEKATNAIKKADKNGDGVIDKEEQEAVKKVIFEKARPLFMQLAMKERAEGFGSQGQPFGKPGFGPQGQPFGKPGFGPQGQPFGKPGFGPQGQPFGKPGFGPQGQPFGKPGFGPQDQPFGKPGFGSQGQPFGKPGFGPQDHPFGKPKIGDRCSGCDNPECKDCVKKNDKEQQKTEEPKPEEKKDEEVAK